MQYFLDNMLAFHGFRASEIMFLNKFFNFSRDFCLGVVYKEIEVFFIKSHLIYEYFGFGACHVLLFCILILLIKAMTLDFRICHYLLLLLIWLVLDSFVNYLAIVNLFLGVLTFCQIGLVSAWVTIKLLLKVKFFSLEAK